MNGNYTSTGRVQNPGKRYYLELIKECFEELNAKMSGDVSMATKAMIICGLIPDTDGEWKVSQLSKELQAVVNANMPYFHGLDPSQ